MIRKIINLLLIIFLLFRSNISFGQCTLNYDVINIHYSSCTCSSFAIQNITGGVGPYQFSYYQPNFFIDWNIFEPVCTGKNKFWIKDIGTGCIVEDSIVINQPTDPSFGNQYIGANDGIWENPDNWSCGSVPDFYSDVFITSGNILINSNVIVNSLTILGGRITIASGYTVTIQYFGAQ